MLVRIPVPIGEIAVTLARRGGMNGHEVALAARLSSISGDAGNDPPAVLDRDIHHVGLDELEGVARLRFDVYADDLKACAVVAHRRPAGSAEEVKEAGP